jgi:outer membrane protein assembly factor BamD
VLTRISVALLAASLWFGCSKGPPTFEDVPPAEELFAEGQDELQGQRLLWMLPWVNYDDAIEKFQAIIDNYPYSEYAVLAELAIADAYFADRRYEEALSYYRDFIDLHPQHEKIPYTIFQAAMCHERRVKSANRDQTATRDALQFLDQLLATYPYSDYADEAEEIWRDLRTRLATQIQSVGDFYMRKGEYEAAAVRYRSLLNEYPGLGLDAEALYKLAVCYEEMNRRDEAEDIYQAIVQNYRDTSEAQDAADRIAAMN